MKSQRDALIAVAIGFLATTAVELPWVIEAHIAKAERSAAYEQAAIAGHELPEGRRPD